MLGNLLFLYACFSIYCCGDCVTIRQSNESVREFTTRLFQGYDKMVGPHRPDVPEKTSSPTEISVSIYIDSLTDVNSMTMHYSSDLYLSQFWNDPRLQYEGFEPYLILNDIHDNFWLPDTCFLNAKEGRFHFVTQSNRMLRLYKNGDILYSVKMSMRLVCHMELTYFPMDIQVCGFELGSSSKENFSIVYRWLNPADNFQNMTIQPIEINEHLLNNEFLISSKTFKEYNRSYSIGKFSVIDAFMELHRMYRYYLIFTYGPTTLTVMISWLSFFIEISAVPARISLCLLSLLSLMTQTMATIQNLPRVSYIKAIDIWLFVCLSFVVCSTLEFTIAYSLHRKQAKRRNLENNLKFENETEETKLNLEKNAPRNKKVTTPKPSVIDAVFKWAYPVLFILFCSIYWIYYTCLR